MDSGGRSRGATRWGAHPVASRLVRISIVVVPFLTAMVVAYGLSLAVPLASTTAGTVGRWLGIIAASTVAMRVVDRLARRLLPLSTLLELTLVFPDQAPSRFAIAMKTGTTRQLAARIEAARQGRPGETPAEAAERLLELVGLLSHHDRLTRGHSERVRAYTHLIGQELGLTETELDKIRWAGLLHDIGKVSVASEILNKPGRLTDEEYETVKTHPMAGRELVEPLSDWLGDSLRAVWEHHEKFDGTGYPQGLAGTEISMAARIVAVADVYDVMTSARSYKAPMPAADAREELARCAGTHFDPIVVRAFFNISLDRLRLMAGPAAWLAQLALFEPTGVVHAGSGSPTVTSASGSAGSSGASSAVAASGASATGTAATSAVATSLASTTVVGGVTVASVVTTTAAVTLGVASGAVGVSAAESEVTSVDMIAEEQVLDVAFGDLGDPSSTLALVDDRGGVRLSTTGKLGGGGTAKSGGDVFGSSGVDDEEPPIETTPAGTAPGQETRETTPAGTAPGQETRETTPAGTAPAGPPSTTPAGNVPGGPPSTTPAGNVPGGPPSTTPADTRPTAPPVTQPTAPPVSTPPVSTPPVTQPIVTQPVVTQPAVTQPAVTQPAVTQPASTQTDSTGAVVTTPTTPAVTRP